MRVCAIHDLDPRLGNHPCVVQHGEELGRVVLRDLGYAKHPRCHPGGQLGEAYIHGMNGITEGVRQIRGTSHNQVDNVEHFLVTSGTGVPTSGLILGVDA